MRQGPTGWEGQRANQGTPQAFWLEKHGPFYVVLVERGDIRVRP